MSSLIPFSFESHQVRIVEHDGDVLFVARDVAVALGYANPPEAVREHCKHSKSLKDMGGAKRSPYTDQQLTLDPQTKLIPESDVFRLVMRSKLEGAERFQDWVCEEVLPSIRKSGSYSQPAINPANFSRMQLIELAMQAEQERLAIEQKAIALEHQVEVLEPKAEALDRISGSDGSLNITETAKALGQRPKDMFSLLQARHWIYKRPGGRNWLGYQDKCQQGLVEHKVSTVTMPDGSEKISEQVRVTPKGITRLSHLLSGHAA
jgi:prophage antirepressor-like protein